MEEKYVMNRQQKWEHFKEYYKWHTIVAVVIIIAVISTIIELRGIVDPDYSIGLISKNYISTETLEAMEDEIEKYISDINNDGKKDVSINLYQIDYEGATDTEVITANVTKLFADLSLDEVFIYIIDGVNEFSHLVENAFVDSEGNMLESYGTTGVEVDETLFGYALSDTSIFEGIKYYDTSVYDVFEGARVLILDETIFENKKDDVKQDYQNNLDLYNLILQQ